LLKENELPLSARLLLGYSTRMPDHRGKWRVISFLKHLTPPLQKTKVTVEREHLTWSIDPSDHVQSQLLWYGTKDKWEIYHLRRLLRPGAVIFDIGANFGYYSLALAHFLQSDCTVFAFEPNPGTYQSLCNNISLNKLGNVIHPQAIGLSDCEDELSFVEPVGNAGATTLVKGKGVRVTTLDSFVHEHNISRVDVIKIDVEGMERSVLRGARHLFEKIPAPPILVEINPHTLGIANTSASELINDIRLLGFNIYEIHRDTLRRLGKVPNGDGYINVLCLPQKHPLC
jgi:FkbM family methyltransferase